MPSKIDVFFLYFIFFYVLFDCWPAFPNTVVVVVVLFKIKEGGGGRGVRVRLLGDKQKNRTRDEGSRKSFNKFSSFLILFILILPIVNCAYKITKKSR